MTSDLPLVPKGSRRSESPLATFRTHKRIVVTRAEEQSETITLMLEQLGATVLVVPTIKIELAELPPESIERISKFYDYDVAIFTSLNAVKYFFGRVNPVKGSSGKPFIVAIGKKTAEALKEFGIVPGFVPGKFNSEELMKSLGNFEWNHKKVLIPTGNLSSGEITDSVKSHGGVAEAVVVYNTKPNDSINDGLKRDIASGKFDMIIFFSPSQVKNFLNIFGAGVLKGKQIAVIGPTTQKAVEHHGLKVDVVPENSTTEDLIASIVEHEKN